MSETSSPRPVTPPACTMSEDGRVREEGDQMTSEYEYAGRPRLPQDRMEGDKPDSFTDGKHDSEEMGDGDGDAAASEGDPRRRGSEKKPRTERSERKREREKKRRGDINRAFEELQAALIVVDPTRRGSEGTPSEAASVGKSSKAPGGSGGGKEGGLPSNRVELIGRTVRMLERMHRENLGLRQELQSLRETYDGASLPQQNESSAENSSQQQRDATLLVPVLVPCDNQGIPPIDYGAGPVPMSQLPPGTIFPQSYGGQPPTPMMRPMEQIPPPPMPMGEERMRGPSDRPQSAAAMMQYPPPPPPRRPSRPAQLAFGSRRSTSYSMRISGGPGGKPPAAPPPRRRTQSYSGHPSSPSRPSPSSYSASSMTRDQSSSRPSSSPSPMRHGGSRTVHPRNRQDS